MRFTLFRMTGPPVDFLTLPGHPNLCHNHEWDSLATPVLRLPNQFVPNIPLRCSRANRSIDPHNRDAPGYDEHNSKWPRNAGLTASRAPRCERKPCAHEDHPFRSIDATCGHEAGQVPAKAFLHPTLQQAHDSDSAERTRQMSGSHDWRASQAGSGRTHPSVSAESLCSPDVRNRQLSHETANGRSSACAEANATDIYVLCAMPALQHAALE